MAYANTIDERYNGGSISFPAGRWDVQDVLGTAGVLAEDDPAFGTLNFSGGSDVDIYSLGVLAPGKYLVDVADYTWDSVTSEVGDVASFNVLRSTGVSIGVSLDLKALVLTVHAGETFYLMINGPFALSAQYTASYLRLGSVDQPTPIISSASHILGPGELNLYLTGASAINGTGNALNNFLRGNAANNVLNGGAGNDTMHGGLGSDTYVVDSAGDRVVEVGAGADRVHSSVSHTLAMNVESLVLAGAAAINGAGNALNNTLIGNAANNVLNGGAGNDTMHGGLGSDTYVVDSAGDRVVEAGAGADRVHSSVSHTLAMNVESLVLAGAAAINGAGNALNNTLIGNAANNVLNGGAGNDIIQGGLGSDTYIVDSAGDRVVEVGAGADRVHSSVSHTLAMNVESLVLAGAAAINGAGNALNNTLIGNVANNILNGGAGNDTMHGGLGSDTYVVDSAGDRVVEAGAGADRVHSSVSHTLAMNVESLVLAGAAAINGAGNALNNTLIGNAANNVLNGGAGNDTMQGGLGNDVLVGSLGRDLLNGGPGFDTFVFMSAAETVRGAARDAIQGFQHGLDHINLAGIDANAGLAGNQAFTFIGAGAYSGTAGQLAYRAGIVSADVNGDRVSDLEVGIVNLATLTQADFIL